MFVELNIDVHFFYLHIQLLEGFVTGKVLILYINFVTREKVKDEMVIEGEIRWGNIGTLDGTDRYVLLQASRRSLSLTLCTEYSEELGSK